MSFSKKGRFDPAAERSRLKSARNIATQLQEISKQFWKVACEAVAPASSSTSPPSHHCHRFCLFATRSQRKC